MKHQQRNLLIVFLFGLITNIFFAALYRYPGVSLDAAYYFSNGVLLAEEGWSFQEPYFWNYINAPNSLPHPAFGYWQPLPSIISAIGISLFGDSLAAAKIPFILLATLLPLLTYRIAYDLGPSKLREQRALLAGLLISVAGFFAPFWSTPETMTPYALAGAGCLYLIACGSQGKHAGWAWFVAGALTGLAYLTRNDGLLLYPVAGLFCLVSLRTASIKTVVRNLALLTVGLGITVAPWFVRNLNLYGTLLQPSGGMSTIFLVDEFQMVRYPTNISPEIFFAQSFGDILLNRWDAIRAIGQSIIHINTFIVLLPFVVLAIRDNWRNVWLHPVLLYALLLFLAMTLVFSVPGKRGSWVHSSAALMPYIVVLAAWMVEDLTVRVKPREKWGPDQAFAALGAFVVLASMGAVTEIALRTIPWHIQELDAFIRLDDILDERDVPDDAVVMSSNPPAVYYYTGRSSIQMVVIEVEELLAAAEHYNASYIFTEPFGPEVDPFLDDRDISERCFAIIDEIPQSRFTLYEITCLNQ